MRRRPKLSLIVLANVLAVTLALPAAAGEETGGPAADPTLSIETLREGAAAAYESGLCGDVLEILSRLEQEGGSLDGVDLYRRGFCLARTRQPGAEEQYALAAARLGERTEESGARVDDHFYRVNALLNLDRIDEARAAAAFAAKRYAAGELVVPQESPDAWFRLGKLFRDAGDNAGALDPFRRALDASASGGTPLRPAYLRRIARAAREAGKSDLAARAAELDASTSAAGPPAAYAEARALVTKGELEAAKEAFQALRRVKGDISINARYAAASIDRALEVIGWKRQPVQTVPDGPSVASLELGELQAELYAVAREAATAIAEGEIVTRPTKKGKRTLYLPTEENLVKLRDLQARLSGLLLEAVQRDAPLREWAVSGGFAHMVYSPLPLLFRTEAQKRASDPMGTSTAE